MRPWEANGGPDEPTLRELIFHRKMSNQAIGRLYNVDEAAVRYWLRKAGISRNTAPRVDHRQLGTVPWSLDATKGHTQDPIARLLRARGRHHAGLPVPADVLGRLVKFEAELAARGRVVDYDPETDEGFMLVRRDPAIDSPDSIVRQPQPQN